LNFPLHPSGNSSVASYIPIKGTAFENLPPVLSEFVMTIHEGVGGISFGTV